MFQVLSYSGRRSSPSSSSPNSSSTGAAPRCPAVFGLDGAWPRGSEYEASIKDPHNYTTKKCL